MRSAIRNYFVFLGRSARIAFVGDWRYYAWMAALTGFCLLGLNAYAKQFVHGLVVTGMSDEVSWGVYIANFTFLVGVAAAAVESTRYGNLRRPPIGRKSETSPSTGLSDQGMPMKNRKKPISAGVRPQSSSRFWIGCEGRPAVGSTIPCTK